MTLRRCFRLDLGLALGLLLQACTSPARPGGKRAVEIVPPRLDLGVLTQNESAGGTVELRNLGGSPVRLGAGASSARCRWQGLPEKLAPGATARLAVLCQSDLLGPLREGLMVLDASRGDGLAALSIVGRVEPIIGFDTAFVDLRPDFGQVRSADVRLIGKHASRALPKVTTTGGDVVRVCPLTASAGGTPGLRVSCRGDRVGMHAGSLVVATGLAEQPTLTLSWGCRVPATLEVEPATPYFNLREGGDHATTVVVRSSQPGFSVRSVRIIEGPFSATLEKPNPDGSIPITIRVKKHAIPDDARTASGKLLIHSNDAREPRKEVPLFGFGKVNKLSSD
ncbi:MAG: hypothetical protein JXP73_16130 [Deltaproteobacteria bacterium]|nr:hypothetical protein [Deltaproteobacteria bacterium]